MPYGIRIKGEKIKKRQQKVHLCQRLFKFAAPIKIKIKKMKKILVLLLCVLLALPGEAKRISVCDATFVHPWSGKRVAYFGDSITDPNNKGSKKKYWNYLQELLGITPYVYGVSGRQWNDIPRQARQLKSEHGDQFDAILIFIGTNDFNAAVPIGHWYNETEDSVVAAVHKPKSVVLRRKRTPSMDKDTYRGRINIALSTIKKMFPTKQVVLLTPIHRAYFCSGNSNIQPTEQYQNACGEYFDAYVQSVKEAGNIWAMPVIDLNSVSGLYPLFDESAIYYHTLDTDRLHPNDAGHWRIAKTLYYQLATLPCDFSFQSKK